MARRSKRNQTTMQEKMHRLARMPEPNELYRLATKIIQKYDPSLLSRNGYGDDLIQELVLRMLYASKRWSMHRAMQSKNPASRLTYIYKSALVELPKLCRRYFVRWRASSYCPECQDSVIRRW